MKNWAERGVWYMGKCILGLYGLGGGQCNLDLPPQEYEITNKSFHYEIQIIFSS